MQIIVMGHPDLSSQLCEAGAESSHPPSAMFSHRMNYPLLTRWKWPLVTSTTSWMPLDDVNLLIWKRASPETKHALVCLASPVGSDNPRVLWRLRPALAWWTETASLICLLESPPRLTPATPKEIPLPKLKTVLTQLLIQHSPFLVKSFFTVRVYTSG